VTEQKKPQRAAKTRDVGEVLGELAGQVFDAIATSPEFVACWACGCTQERACEEGCEWPSTGRYAGKDICSACVEKGRKLPRKRDRFAVHEVVVSPSLRRVLEEALKLAPRRPESTS